MNRVDTMANYIKIDEKGVIQLIKSRKDPDTIRETLKKYALEDWVPHVVASYDAVALALAEEVIRRNKPIETQMMLKDLKVGVKKEKEELIIPKKELEVSGYGNVKGYKRTSPGRFENRERVKLFISSRVSMDNSKLTKEYNDWAFKNGYKLRTKSSIVTLKSRIKRDKWN